MHNVITNYQGLILCAAPNRVTPVTYCTEAVVGPDSGRDTLCVNTLNCQPALAKLQSVYINYMIMSTESQTLRFPNKSSMLTGLRKF